VHPDTVSEAEPDTAAAPPEDPELRLPAKTLSLAVAFPVPMTLMAPPVLDAKLPENVERRIVGLAPMST
jgi:hypothetical protein